MNNFISINNLDSMITEARNTLTHTFSLNYEPDSLLAELNQENPAAKISRMSKYMHEACLPLFCPVSYDRSTVTKLNGLCNGTWQFFGDLSPNDSTPQKRAGVLSCLTSTQYYKVWESMLTHHCLLTTYDKLHDIIFHEIEISGYHLMRLFDEQGFHYALKNGNFHIGTENGHFNIPELQKNSKSKVADSNRASNYGRNSYPSKLGTIKEIFISYPKLTEIGKYIKLSRSENAKQKYTKVVIPMNIFPLLQRIGGKGKDFANICKLYNSQQSLTPMHLNKFIDSVSSIQELTPDEVKCMTKTDILYSQYKLEQVFNFNLVYCLTKNIRSFDKRFEQRMHDDSTFIDTVSSVVNLPNTFSRPFLIQMAFDCCADDLHLDSSFLVTRVNSSDMVMSVDKRSHKMTDTHNLLRQWRDCYNNFVNYMAELVFPVYESYFFVMMYDMFSDSESSPAQTILNLYTTLGDYLSNEEVFKEISNDYYIKLIKDIYNPSFFRKPPIIKDDDFIMPDHFGCTVQPKTLEMVTLSTYNNTPASMPALISRDYLYEHFPRSKECFLTSCTADLLK